jgi:hypothetical protein
MRVGQHYREDQDCRCEIEVTKTSKEAASNPRCSCGAEMKTLDTKPAATMLDQSRVPAYMHKVRR